VPRELRGMTEDALLPLLRERGLGTTGEVIGSRTLRTTGIAESLLQDRVTQANVAAAQEGVSLAYLPGVDGVDLRLTAQGDSATVADRLGRMATALRSAVGESIYGEDNDDLAAVLLAACRERGLKVAVAESCTGGLLGARLTAIPGASDVFVGGVIAYANGVKQHELGVRERTLVEHGAVSGEVVGEMAAGARKKFGVDLALAITGIAGPSGGTAEKPVGLVWIAAAYGERLETRRIQSWGDRQEVRYRAAQAAMELARRLLST